MAVSLQKAIACLTIHDVFMNSSNSHLAEGFEPKYDPDTEELEIQFRHVVTHSTVMELSNEVDEPLTLFRVFIDLGARWVVDDGQESSDADNFEEQDEIEDTEDIRAVIEGVMVAEYKMENDPGPEALKAFALNNASYHVWPYWREYLTSQSLRMNLPKTVLPTWQVAQNQERE